MSNFAVVYDANVLYPAPLRDLLMELALKGMYRAKWTEQIHDEWTRHVLVDRPDIPAEKIARTRELMNAHIRDCLVTGYEFLIEGLDLPDKDGRHVLAAAIASHASVIVTFNLKDFPRDKLEHFSVEAQHPDEFISDLFDLNSALVIQAVRTVMARMRNPLMSAEEYFDCLMRQGLPETVKELRRFATLL